jgi:hypothetical protein
MLAPIGEMRNLCKMLLRKPEENGSLERPRSRWEITLKMNIKYEE